MKKPELVIESQPDDDFLKAACSSCPDVRFSLRGNTLSQKALLRRMFDAHFRQVHLNENASQAAARIVREATEDH